MVLAAWLLASTGIGRAQDSDAAHALRKRHDGLVAQLASNQFQRPLHLASVQSSNDVKGEVYAVIEHPFPVVKAALGDAEQWCDILMLHLNVKDCRASGSAAARTVAVTVGRKQEDPLSRPFRIEFAYQRQAATAEYLRVQLGADHGPLMTSDYRIEVEATMLDARHSFLHMTYAYTYGTSARLAMQSYLATLGRDKVGFSVVGQQADGEPMYVGGVRGVIERNTMRYYLAIDAYLGALSLPPAERAERRLHDWYASTERYRRQLHELEREEYLAAKRRQLREQRVGAGD